jgi:hypothetical protein
VQALEALQERQLKAAAVLKQLRMTQRQANKPQMEGQEQWMQQSMAYNNVSRSCGGSCHSLNMVWYAARSKLDLCYDSTNIAP